MNQDIENVKLETRMTEKEKALYGSKISVLSRVLEWGSGGSTIEFGERARQYTTIEHDFIWYGLVSAWIRKKDLYHKINLHLVREDDHFTRYAMMPFEIGKPEYDIALVDGRRRVMCAMTAWHFLSVGGYLFVHDYDRERYHFIEAAYRLIEQVDTLAMFGKRSSPSYVTYR